MPPLPPGAYFPMDPTPVRDGLPLWSVDVRLISRDYDIWDRWQDAYELSDPRLEGVRGYGLGELPDNRLIYSTSLRIWAADEAEACAVAGPLVDRLAGVGAGRRRLRAEPAYHDDYFELPRSPEDYEPSLVKTAWHRHKASPKGVKIAWFTGPCPLARVDVDETPAQVTVTLWERYPPAFLPGGGQTGITAIGLTRCVEVPLRAPLGDRAVIDGSTGRAPEDIEDFDYVEYNARDQLLDTDIDALGCQPMPSPE